MSKSKIYKELNENEIKKIVFDLYGNKEGITNYKILKGGLFNTTYFVKTKNDDNGIVIRVSPVNQHLLFEFEKSMMSAEPYFHKLLEDNGIPTSKILKYVPFGDIIDREYIISKYINSIPMNDPSLINVDLENVYEEVGKLTSNLHKITNSKFGWKRMNDWGQYDSWSEFVLVFAKEIEKKIILNNLFSNVEINKFSEVFKQNFSILNEIKVPYFTHADLWQGNILITPNGNEYKVAGIIDIDRAIFGDINLDLSNPWIINQSFLKGYNPNINSNDNDNVRIKLYKLLGEFFSAYVWLIQYDDREIFESTKNNAVLLLNELNI